MGNICDGSYLTGSEEWDGSQATSLLVQVVEHIENVTESPWLLLDLRGYQKTAHGNCNIHMESSANTCVLGVIIRLRGIIWWI